MNTPDVAPDPAAERSALDRTARLITEVLAPWVVVLVLPVAVAATATGSLVVAVGWGLLVALTSSLLPMAVILWGARSGKWDGHHVRDRKGRLVPFLVLLALSAVGLVLLVLGGAPWPVIVLDVAMIATLIVTGAITAKWKVSMHTAVAGGAVVILAVTWGAVWSVLSLAVAAIAWSRVRVRDHTPAQTAVGAAVGAFVGGGLYAILL